MKMYVREIKKNGEIIISTLKTGAITGVVDASQIEFYVNNSTTNKVSTFIPYIVKVNVDTLNVRNGAGTNYKINT
jgi:hypothetical protein